MKLTYEELEQKVKELENKKYIDMTGNIDNPLSVSEETLISIIDSTSDLIWSIEAESFKLKSFNNAYQAHFMKTRGIQIRSGLLPEEIVPENIVKFWYELYRRAINEGAYTIDYFTHDKSQVLQLAFNQIYKNGEIVGISVFGKNITDHKKAEISLKENQRFLGNIIANLPGMVYRCENNTDWSMQFVSDGSIALLGYKPEQLIQSGEIEYGDLIHQDDRQMVWNTVQTGIQANQPFQMEYRIINSNGIEKWVWEQGYGVYNKDGVLEFIEGYISDITERKKTEKAIIDSNVYNRQLFSTTQIGLALAKMTGELIDINQSYADIIGYTIGETLLLTYWEITPEKYLVKEKEQLNNLYEKGFYGPYEKEYIHKNGSLVPVVLSGNIIELNGEKFIWSCVEDITERKKADVKLKQSEERLSSFMNSASDSFYLLDADLNFVEINSKALEFIGKQKIDIIGKNIADIVPDIKSSGRYEKHLEVIKTGKPFTIIDFIPNPVFGDKHFVLNSFKVGSGLGVIVYDVTLLKNQELELKKLLKAIEHTEVSIVVTNLMGEIEYANPFFTQLSGYSKDEYLGKNPKFLNSGIHSNDFYKEMWHTIVSGNTWTGEFCNCKKNGEFYWEKSTITPIKGKNEEIVNFVAVKSDITQEKKHKNLIDITLELYEKSEHLAIEEIMSYSIELGIQLTNSEIGYFHLVNDDQETISLQAWSAKSMEMCNIPTLNKHYPISQAGIWVDCFFQRKSVYHNDYSSVSHKRGLPEGHTTLFRDLAVPVIIQNQVVAIFGVGNKKYDYNQTDAEFLSIFAENLWNVVRRKNAEETLKKSESQLENALDMAKLGHWEYEVESDIFTFNDNFYSIFRTNVENENGYNMSSAQYVQRFVHPDDSHLFSIETQKAIETLDPKFSSQLEHRIIYADGDLGYINVHYNILKDTKGRTIKTYGVNQDITERKLSDEKLLERELNYQGLFDTVKHAIYIQNPDLSFITVNQGAVDMYGYDREDFIGKTPAFLSAPDRNDLEKIVELVNLANQGKPQKYEFWGLRKNGEIFPKDVWTIKGKYFGKDVLFTLADDITERKKIEENLKNQNQNLESQYEEYLQLSERLTITNINLELAKEKAEESDRLKTAFLQNMSHEIRTPLNSILGFSNLLQSDDLSKEDIKDFTGIIQESGNRLMETVGNILDISRIETGQIEIKNMTFSLNTLLSNLYSFFLNSAAIKGVLLKYNIGLSNPHSSINTDELKLKQILTNLINNAIKFTINGEIEFGYTIKNSEIEFYIKDSGIGIPVEMRNRIFSRFAQVNLDITRGYEGVGLGLPICEGLTKLLGGKIWFESKENEGTTFFFTIPFVQSSEIQNLEYDSIKTVKIKKEIKILIAEDDLTSYQYLSKLLKDDKFFILYAKNGQEAVDIVRDENDIDLVLMDIKMPVMNGIDATIIIKELRPDLTIIAQTAYAFSSERDEILSIGCSDYLSKPIKKSELMILIDKYTKRD
jgi:PAS domain S-box-containing protein